jgi:hypothetical protein
MKNRRILTDNIYYDKTFTEPDLKNESYSKEIISIEGVHASNRWIKADNGHHVTKRHILAFYKLE